MYQLIFQSGPLRGKRFTIRQGPVTIGRDPECHIAVADNEISGKHAIIERREEGFFIRDLGSVKGMLVNDKACRESKLKHNDMIEIGRTVMFFRQIGQADAPEKRRTVHSQGLAFAAVCCTILIQLALVIGFSIWHRDIMRKAEKTSLDSSSQPSSSAAATKNPAMEIQSVKQRQAEKVIPAGFETNIQQKREKLRKAGEETAPVRKLAKPDIQVSSIPAATSSIQNLAEEARKKVDPLTAKAQQMLQAAQQKIADGNLAQADQQMETEPPHEKKQPPERLARRIKIVSVELQRFPENDQFDEMRLFRITLSRKRDEHDMDLSEIRVSVLFFDEETSSQNVNLTRVAVPKDALRLDGEWNQAGQQTVTAAYIVPKNFRKDEWEKYHQKLMFFGYLVQVYYQEQLQDEDARPKALLQKADALKPHGS